MKEKNQSYKYTNKLINENSPYLLSHAHNPVDWYPWGEEALAKARQLDRPIFLSIGYAACHWCHVMERESFENEAIAALMNENFINIKVDREQRPDLDTIYMAFTTALTGSGGWPMSVFLTPQLKPFFAGTYFPVEEAFGRPGFGTVLTEITRAYRENKTQITSSAETIFRQLEVRLSSSRTAALPGPEITTRAVGDLMRNFDRVYGGFGEAPKFPHPLELSLLLRYYQRSGDAGFLEAVRTSLVAMAHGGIYDHVGGGFARYAVDRRWLVPHFEKMLYDNALLVSTYGQAYQVTGDEFYRMVVRETLDFILRELTGPEGGFYSALDADSEGEEGKFYVWSKDEIEALLGPDSSDFMRYFNVSQVGNFDGKNILNITAESSRVRMEKDVRAFDRMLVESRKVLLETRSKRVRPLTDDKILTSWNGLALTAFCKGYQVTGEKRYLDAALKNAGFVTGQLLYESNLTHTWRKSVRSEGFFLEDYAYYIEGLVHLYESDGAEDHRRWLEYALFLADRAVELFFDAAGVFYLRPDGCEDLIVRPRDEYDSAVPSPASVMMLNLLKLNRITGREGYWQTAKKALEAVSGRLAEYPSGMTSALFALDYYLNEKVDIVVVGNGTEREKMLKEIYRKFIPNRFIAVSNGDSELYPLFEGRTAPEGGVAVYICRNEACRKPVTSLEQLIRELDHI